MNNVIWPKAFQNGIRPTGAMSQQTMTALYSAMMNLYYSANGGCLSNARLVSEMVKSPNGMNGADTLACASIVSNNAIMLEKIRDCMGEMMKILVVEGAKNQISSICVPDDPPPAA